MRTTKAHASVALVASICLLVLYFGAQEAATGIQAKASRTLTLRAEKNNNITRLVSNLRNGQGGIRERNIFYNRVSKCGSRSLISAIRRVSTRNNFTWLSSGVYGVVHPQPREASEEVKKIANLQPPTFYNRPVHYLDFEAFGYRQPIYINMIRDPVARFSSWYNYLKYGDARRNATVPKHWPEINECVMKEINPCIENGEIMFYIGRHFCGLDPTCAVPGPQRLNLVKNHIDEKYSFVGMLEEFINTLRLLETMLPEYFGGIVAGWAQNHTEAKETATRTREVLTEESIAKLKHRMMVDEYQVYYHAKQKFAKLKQQYGIE